MRWRRPLGVVLLGFVLTVWWDGRSSGQIRNSFTLAPAGEYSGVEVWQSGHDPLNSFEVTGFHQTWGFTRITGYEAGHPVIVLVAPHWLFAIISLGILIWWGKFERSEHRQRFRRAAGQCVACGYNLTGNTSGVCPECGAPITRGATPVPQASRHESHGNSSPESVRELDELLARQLGDDSGDTSVGTS